MRLFLYADELGEDHPQEKPDDHNEGACIEDAMKLGQQRF
jgi:hypothetical protein